MKKNLLFSITLNLIISIFVINCEDLSNQISLSGNVKWVRTLASGNNASGFNPIASRV